MRDTEHCVLLDSHDVHEALGAICVSEQELTFMEFQDSQLDSWRASRVELAQVS